MPSQMFRGQNEETLLKALLHELDEIGLVTWSAEGRITSLNASCRRLMQLPRAARVGASISTLWCSPCEAFKQEFESFKDAPRRKDSLERVLRLSRDGSDYWLRLRLRASSKNHGKESAYLLLVRDVTARRKHEQDPIETLRRYERMVSSSRDALVLLDRDHRYLAANQAYLEFWGKQRREVLGHHISEIVGQTFYEQISVPALKECLSGRTVVFTTKYIDYPCGGRYVEATHNPYRDDHGAICGVLLTLRDVTQRHLAELALQESEAKFRAIFDYAPVGVGILDEQSGRVLDINLDGASMLGYSRDEILQLRPWDVTEGLTPEDFFASWARIRERGRVRFESTHIKKDGSKLHVLINAISTSLQGRSVLIMTVVDITRQKSLESRLREQEHQYRSLVESTSAILFSADPRSLRFTFVSPEAEKLLGYPLRQWLEEPDFWVSHMHPEDHAWAPDYCLAASRNKQDHSFDYRMLAADGREVWLHDVTRVVMEGERVDSLVGVMVDISEQKRAEAERWRLSEIVEQSADAILLTDIDFRITYINEAFHKLYGYTLEELRGERPEMFIAEAYAPEISPQIYAALREGERVIRELVNRRKDGSLFTCQHNIAPLRDAGGGIIAYMSSQRDVSQRVQAERALRQSEEKYRQIVETAQEGIWVLDARDRTSFVNSSMARMLGYTESEMLGRPPFEFMDESLRGEAESRLQEHRQGRSSVFEFRLRDKGGRDVWVSVSANPRFDDHGHYAGAIAMIDDISEARSLREALIRSQKMEAVGQLTGGIAHDFNNILGSILGFTELARERFGGEHDKLREYLRQIEIAGGRARDLIRKLLIFSRGENINSAKSIALGPLVKEILGMLKPVLPAMVEIRADIPQESLYVTIDPLHVQQLLMNLCINARDAIDGAGLITVTLARRQVEGELCSICDELIQGEWISLRVSDTGHGIPEGLSGDIFQPFVTSKEVGEGSGMGLAVVRGILRSYGGHLRMESVAERGASFEMLFPPCDAVAQEGDGGEVSEGAGVDLKGRSILLVDDEPQNLAYFEEIFAGLGAEVVSCGNGAQALGRFAMASGAFDLVVSDQAMPGMSGRELAQQLRNLGSEVPVILCSGYSEIVDEETARSLNIIAHLQKPVSKAMILAAIELSTKRSV